MFSIMQIIKCKCGADILLDDHCNPAILKDSWNCTNSASVKTSIKGKPIALSWQILDGKKGFVIDHIDRNIHNNQLKNLRLVTGQQNVVNSKLSSVNSSGYKGVSWHRATRRWAATIGYNYKTLHLGLFRNKIDAAKAYNEKAFELFGEFAALNIID